VTAAFISILDNLVGEFDLADLLDGLVVDCVRVLDVVDAGLVLADTSGRLTVTAATSETVRRLMEAHVDPGQSPWADCFAHGEAVQVSELDAGEQRWPQVGQGARDAGFVAVHALPLRLQRQTLGALALFDTSAGDLSPINLRLGQALAHSASIALAVHEILHDQVLANAQLQTALSSRLLLERAKGAISERGDLSIDVAFDVLRQYSRNHNQKLSSVARSIADGKLSATEVLAPFRRPDGTAPDRLVRRAQPPRPLPPRPGDRAAG
jgi:transcriptional regulator with GAF, ATPase, and Fis domain